MSNKYRAVRTNGYASKFEAKVAVEVHALAERCGYEVIEQRAIKFACGTKYICDFYVHGQGHEMYIEAKGKETPVWRLKLRMLKHEHPEIYKSLLIVFNRNKGGKLTKMLGGWASGKETV